MNSSGVTIKGVYYPTVTCLRGTYYKVDLDKVGELREAARSLMNEADKKYGLARDSVASNLYFKLRAEFLAINQQADDLLVASNANVKAGLPPAAG